MCSRARLCFVKANLRSGPKSQYKSPPCVNKSRISFPNTRVLGVLIFFARLFADVLHKTINLLGSNVNTQSNEAVSHFPLTLNEETLDM